MSDEYGRQRLKLESNNETVDWNDSKIQEEEEMRIQLK